MDKFFIGDIDSSYCYAQFGQYYIDLYNTNELTPNNSYDYYRVYLYDNQFMYSTGVNTRNNYSSVVYLDNIDVTNDIRYRRDFPSIILMWFIYIIIALWVFNFMTNIIKKGGLLNGLL